MESATIYFEVTWVAKDSRNSKNSSYSHGFSFKLPLKEEELNRRSLDSYNLFQLWNKFSHPFDSLFPEFDDRKHKLVYFAPDGYGESVLIDTNNRDNIDRDLTSIIYKHKGSLSGAVIQLSIESREKKRSMNAAFGTTYLGDCVECGSKINGVLFKCFQCKPNYILCCLCATFGNHPEHIIIRIGDPKMGFETVLKQLMPTSPEKKVDLTQPEVLEKLDVLEATTKLQGAELSRVINILERLNITT